jgi:hypothetical protein
MALKPKKQNKYVQFVILKIQIQHINLNKNNMPSNKQFFTALILILIPTLIFFANIKTSRAAPLGADLAASINSAFASNAIYPLTNQQIIDKGCKNLTSELVQNIDNLTLFTTADLSTLVKTHKGILSTNQNKVLPILTAFQSKITSATGPIDYNALNGFIDEVYDSMFDLTNPIQDSNNALYDVFFQTSDISAEVLYQELDFFLGNQDFSVEYIFNALDSIQKDINNNLTKVTYTRAEAQVIFEDVKLTLEDEFLNMQDRTDQFIVEFDSGLGSINSVAVTTDDECDFKLRDVLGVEKQVIVPIIKQYVCDSLYLKESANVQYNSGNCLVYK